MSADAVIAGAAVVTGLVAIGDAVAGYAQRKKEMNLQQSQFDAQYALTLESNLNDYKKGLADIKGQLGIAEQQVLQTQSNIGSSYDYLSRWQQEADNQLQSATTEAKSQYSQIANNWGATQAVLSETGNVGKSANLISQMANSEVRNLVGESLMFNTGSGVIGSQINALQNDILANKENALSGIDMDEQTLEINKETVNELNKRKEESQALVDSTQAEMDVLNKKKKETQEKQQYSDEIANAVTAAMRGKSSR